MKKVVFVSCTDFLGGAEVLLFNIHKLLSRNLSIHFIVASKELYGMLPSENATLLGTSNFLRTINIVNSSVRAILPDVIVLNGNRAIYLAPFLKTTGRVVAYKHTGIKSVGGRMKTAIYKLIVSHAYKYCRRIICVSKAIAREVKVPDHKKTVIYNGVDSSWFCCRKLDQEQAIVITFVGRLVKEKGILDALDVLKEMNGRLDFKFFIVGTGSLQLEISKYIESHNLDNFYLMGQLRDVKPILEKTDIFLYPSYYESFGLAICEAMSMEIPIVSSRIGGIPEVVREGIDGYLTSVRDRKSLKEALEKLVVNRDLRLEMGRSARSRIVDKFDQDKFASSLLEELIAIS